MNVLAFELSSSRGSVALLEDNVVIFAREFANNRKDSGPFFEAVNAAHEQSDNLKLIIVGLGPGSYAGVRTAISAAIGLSAALSAELLGLPSICATETDEREYFVIGDARRSSFFCARIVKGKCAEGPELLKEDALRQRLRANPLPIYSAEKITQFPDAQLAFPSAVRLARIDRIHAMHPPLQPIYLREPHITQPRQASRTLIRT